MSRNSDVTKELTEMEAAVLGALWQNGPCTAYLIRKEFLESVSPRWSGSAGAIYPLLKRMERIGFVESRINNRGKRSQRDYEISNTGLTVFRRWLRNLNPEADAGLLHDPMRSKLFFLDAISKAQAERLVRSALAELREQLRQFESDCEAVSDRKNSAAHLAARNTLLLTNARVVWLEEVLQSIKTTKK